VKNCKRLRIFNGSGGLTKDQTFQNSIYRSSRHRASLSPTSLASAAASEVFGSIRLRTGDPQTIIDDVLRPIETLQLTFRNFSFQKSYAQFAPQKLSSTRANLLIECLMLRDNLVFLSAEFLYQDVVDIVSHLSMMC